MEEVAPNVLSSTVMHAVHARTEKGVEMPLPVFFATEDEKPCMDGLTLELCQKIGDKTNVLGSASLMLKGGMGGAEGEMVTLRFEGSTAIELRPTKFMQAKNKKDFSPVAKLDICLGLQLEKEQPFDKLLRVHTISARGMPETEVGATFGAKQDPQVRLAVGKQRTSGANARCAARGSITIGLQPSRDRERGQSSLERGMVSLGRRSSIMATRIHAW